MGRTHTRAKWNLGLGSPRLILGSHSEKDARKQSHGKCVCACVCVLTHYPGVYSDGEVWDSNKGKWWKNHEGASPGEADPGHEGQFQVDLPQRGGPISVRQRMLGFGTWQAGWEEEGTVFLPSRRGALASRLSALCGDVKIAQQEKSCVLDSSKNQ